MVWPGSNTYPARLLLLEWARSGKRLTTVADVVEEAGVATHSTVSRRLDRLVKQGFVEIKSVVDGSQISRPDASI